MVKIPKELMRIFLYFIAFLGWFLVVLNWWWAFFHDGYVVISFVEFGEIGLEFYLIHGIMILISLFIIITFRDDLKKLEI